MPNKLRNKGRKLYNLLKPSAAEPVRMRQGIVDSVNQNGTLNIRVAVPSGGQGVIKNVQSISTHAPGDGVW